MEIKKSISEFRDLISKWADKTQCGWNRSAWTKKHCAEVAKFFSQVIWYINDICRNSSDVQIYYDQTSVIIVHAKGGSSFLWEDLHYVVLFPEIEKTCSKYGVVFFNTARSLRA